LEWLERVIVLPVKAWFLTSIFPLAILCILATGSPVHAQASVISGNYSESVPQSWAAAPDTRQLQLTAVLALRNTGQLAQLESDLQNRHSPTFHKWLTRNQFVAQFGPTGDQMAAATNWLTSQGFTVTSADLPTRRIQFTGSVATIRQAFATSIVTDGTSYANTSDPSVPPALAIQAVLGMTSMTEPPAAQARRSMKTQIAKAASRVEADAIVDGMGPNFAPSDFYAFYNENPVLNGGNIGTAKPDCVAVFEVGDVAPAALKQFNSQFNLPPVVLKKFLVDKTNPGLPTDNEPALDVEWIHAVSPSTPIYFYLGNQKNSTTPYLDGVTKAVDDDVCGALSSSIEDKNPCPDLSTLNVYNQELEQAVIQGQTFFKSSGDYGDNWVCGNPIPQSGPFFNTYDQSSCGVPDGATGNQPSVDEEATSPFLTSVGGTQFKPVYLSSGADASLVGDGLEVAWNGGQQKGVTPPCPSKNATGGGRSVVFTKPPWQAGLNVPNDGYRDIPDIAIGANGGDSPAFFVYSRQSGQSSVQLVATGGTSIATPMWAGISRLIAQAEGVTRLGNVNQRLYELGNLQAPSSGLHDVTSGNNDDSTIPGYSAGVGFDQVTGWGSPNIAMLVNAFPGAAFKGTSPTPTVSVARRTTATAVTFAVANTTADALELTAIKLSATSPKLLSSVQADATAAGVTQSATAITVKNTVLTFPAPLTIPSGKSAHVTLSVTSANQKGSSNFSLTSGSLSVDDGQGGIVEVGGLPFALCKVTIK
jgi:subtilase family serine protease